VARRRGRFRIGTSGFQYDHWRRRFYPEELPKREWLAHYARVFDSVELNNTFYRLPEASVFEAWRERAPSGFLFALKLSRYATHMKRLLEPDRTIGLFVERARKLGKHLGPILVQLPPRFTPDVARLRDFLAATPRELRWAVEFRDARWLTESVFDALRDHGAALCIPDLLSDHPRVLTSDWTYLRYHGTRYAGSYSAQKLAREADSIAGFIAQGCDAYVYFNNDIGAHAPKNAEQLRRYVQTRVPTSATLRECGASPSP
jgi:uncharacterized protein YecE (DUF72 family)